MNKCVFQGDICLIEVSGIPATARKLDPTGGRCIISHSETGHHHTVEATSAVHFDGGSDPNVCYLQMLSDADVVHGRSWDTHAPVSLGAGKCYIGIRQVERAPEGWRRVAD